MAIMFLVDLLLLNGAAVKKLAATLQLQKHFYLV
jgi:hypothetical protein